MGQFPNCEIKLCDLEVARVIQEGEDIREIIGTPDYVGKHPYLILVLVWISTGFVFSHEPRQANFEACF